MTSLKERRFVPDPAACAVYDELYEVYRVLHDGFGGVPGAGGDLGGVMKRLLAIRERQAARAAGRGS